MISRAKHVSKGELTVSFDLNCHYGITEHTIMCCAGSIVLLFCWLLGAWYLHPGYLGIDLPQGFVGALPGFQAPSREHRGREPGVGKQRCAHMDNAKLILMFMVLLTHCHDATHDWRWNAEIHLLINPFCTRSFGFISGLFDQDAPDGASCRRIIFRLAAPLILYCTFVEPLVLPLVDGTTMNTWDDYSLRVINNLTLSQAGATWYMFALICWRVWAWMLLPFFPMARFAIACAFAAIGGYPELSAFKLDQAIPSFPAFILGQHFPYHKAISRVPNTWFTRMLGFVATAVVFAVGMAPEGRRFLSDLPYWHFGVDVHNHLFLKERETCGEGEAALVWMREVFRNLWELSKCFIFIFLVCPRGNLGGFSALGAQTLYPFFLHYPFAMVQNQYLVMPVESAEWTNAQWGAAWIVECSVVALVICTLASQPVRIVFGPILQPVWLERLMAKSLPDSRCKRDKNISSRSPLRNFVLPLPVYTSAGGEHPVSSGNRSTGGSSNEIPATLQPLPVPGMQSHHLFEADAATNQPATGARTALSSGAISATDVAIASPMSRRSSIEPKDVAPDTMCAAISNTGSASSDVDGSGIFTFRGAPTPRLSLR